MIEKGIIFSGSMVKAILEGRKTMTRRLDKQWLKVKRGDRLWVRETWREFWSSSYTPTNGPAKHETGVEYRATRDSHRDPMGRTIETKEPRYGGDIKKNGDLKWNPSIFMPRWVSRITLEATADARMERLQDISEEDARKEGFEWDNVADDPFYRFEKTWNSLNPKAPWSSNPEVVVLKFRKIEKERS